MPCRFVTTIHFPWTSPVPSNGWFSIVSYLQLVLNSELGLSFCKHIGLYRSALLDHYTAPILTNLQLRAQVRYCQLARVIEINSIQHCMTLLRWHCHTEVQSLSAACCWSLVSPRIRFKLWTAELYRTETSKQHFLATFFLFFMTGSIEKLPVWTLYVVITLLHSSTTF